MDNLIPVKVALRIRPLNANEKNDSNNEYLKIIDKESQVILNKDKSFTFDYLFAPHTTQIDIYEKSVRPLLNRLFKGYNATVLAYGQTCSGKTYTIGTHHASVTQASDTLLERKNYSNEIGIIPRVMQDLFQLIDTSQETTKYDVKVSYLEIYNEEIKDLFNSRTQQIEIREENNIIKVVNICEIQVRDTISTLDLLKTGSSMRVVGHTAMNDQSSRSHAIFTINLEQTKSTGEILKSKFHLVDLAGSERQSRTKAEGIRFKESININLGLLALGNVISVLGEDSNLNGAKCKHVPYRESKLTRLLQDSLGGNSHTLMIACISPASSNLEESLNTLRYADRARKIKNKPIVNVDPKTLEIARLKKEIEQLRVEIKNETSEHFELSNKLANQQARIGELEVELAESKARLTSEKQVFAKKLLDLNERFHLRESELQGEVEQLKVKNNAFVQEIAELNDKFEQTKESWCKEKEDDLAELTDKLEKQISEEISAILMSHRETINRLVQEKKQEKDFYEAQVGELELKINNLTSNRVTLSDSSAQTDQDDLSGLLANKINLLKQIIASKDAYYEQELHKLRQKLNQENYSTSSSTSSSSGSNQGDYFPVDDDQIEKIEETITTTTTKTTLIIKYNQNNQNQQSFYK